MYQSSLLKFAITCFFFLANISAASEPEWSAKEKALIYSLSLSSLTAKPRDKSNRFFHDPRAIALGNTIFHSQAISGNGQTSCASCHKKELGFTDGLARAKGADELGRNTQTLLGVAHQHWFYWDGRRDSLWSQALVPFEAPDEMSGTRVEVLHWLRQNPAVFDQYQRIFGSLPPSLADADFPAKASPVGDRESKEAWDRLSAKHRREINLAFSNIGKALGAYMGTIRFPETRFDRFAKAIISKQSYVDITDREKAGLRLFLDNDKTRCMQCHNGPSLSNGTFHNIGTGNFSGSSLDFGRAAGVRGVELDGFNCLSQFSDADPEDCTALRFLNRSGHVPWQGAFKVPTLRALAYTGPYFHDGRFASLEEVIDHYVNPPEDNGPHELIGVHLSEKEVLELVSFLLMFSND